MLGGMLCAEDRDEEANSLSSNCLQVLFSVTVYRDFGKVLGRAGSKIDPMVRHLSDSLSNTNKIFALLSFPPIFLAKQNPISNSFLSSLVLLLAFHWLLEMWHNNANFHYNKSMISGINCTIWAKQKSFPIFIGVLFIHFLQQFYKTIPVIMLHYSTPLLKHDLRDPSLTSCYPALKWH